MRPAVALGVVLLAAACSEGGGAGNGSTSASGASSGGAAASSGNAASSSGGGGTSSGSSAGGPTPEQVCAEYAAAFCAKSEQCTPWFVGYRWGSVEHCQQRVAVSCPLGFGAPGATITPEAVSECTSAFSVASCPQLASGEIPPACRYAPGTLVDGDRCTFAHQCASEVCRVTGGSMCGVCVPRAADGEDCDTNSDCVDGLVCNGAFCLAPVTLDGECGAVDVCEGALVCDHGFCAGPRQLNDFCDPDRDLCDERKGLFCSGGSTRCTEVALVESGDACGSTLTDLRACRAGGFCLFPGGGTIGECVGVAEDGAACNNSTGPRCESPAFCLQGVCTLADPQQCL